MAWPGLTDQFNTHTAKVFEDLEHFDAKALLMRMLDMHLGRAESTHKMLATQLAQNFENLEVRTCVRARAETLRHSEYDRERPESLCKTLVYVCAWACTATYTSRGPSV